MERYTSLKTTLTAKKEKLFRMKLKDLTEWQIPRSQYPEAIKIANTAELAFKMMLPEQTKRLNYLADESAYFTNQTFKDSRRLLMVDYTMAREHFVDMGE